jgi:hypothetical protein
MDRTTASHIDDLNRRTLLNAQGAVHVVRTSSTAVDGRLEPVGTRPLDTTEAAGAAHGD